MSCRNLLEYYYRVENGAGSFFEDPNNPTSEELFAFLSQITIIKGETNTGQSTGFVTFVSDQGYQVINSSNVACSGACPTSQMNRQACLQCVENYLSIQKKDTKYFRDAVRCLDNISPSLINLSLNTQIKDNGSYTVDSSHINNVWSIVTRSSDHVWFTHSTVLVIIACVTLILSLVVELFLYRRYIKTKENTTKTTRATNHHGQ